MSRERILRSERLVATSWLECDVDDLSAAHSDAETMRFVRQGRPETHPETAALIDQYIAEHTTTGFTKWRVVGLDDRLVGRAGFATQLDGRELGYTIRRELWGQGLATEIAVALVSWHLANAAAIPLYAYVAVDNPASRRVLEKTGFESIGREDHCGIPCELFSYGHTQVGRHRISRLPRRSRAAQRDRSLGQHGRQPPPRTARGAA